MSRRGGRRRHKGRRVVDVDEPPAPVPPAGVDDPWLWGQAEQMRRRHQAPDGETCPACLSPWPCRAFDLGVDAQRQAEGLPALAYARGGRGELITDDDRVPFAAARTTYLAVFHDDERGGQQ